MTAHRKSVKESQIIANDVATTVRGIGGLMLVEAIGAYVLVGGPTAAAEAAATNSAIAGPALNSLAVAVSFGVALAILVAVFADRSGAHFNPAVTIALAVTGGFRKSLAAYYVVAQLIGAVLGSLTVALLFAAKSNARAGGYGVTQPADGFSWLSVGLVEFLGTAGLMFVICRVTDTSREPVPASLIGVTLGGLVLTVGPVSGGAFNPARALAPMFVSGQSEAWGIYVLAEIAGAVAAALLYTRVVATIEPPAAPE